MSTSGPYGGVLQDDRPVTSREDNDRPEAAVSGTTPRRKSPIRRGTLPAMSVVSAAVAGRTVKLIGNRPSGRGVRRGAGGRAAGSMASWRGRRTTTDPGRPNAWGRGRTGSVSFSDLREGREKGCTPPDVRWDRAFCRRAPEPLWQSNGCLFRREHTTVAPCTCNALSGNDLPRVPKSRPAGGIGFASLRQEPLTHAPRVSRSPASREPSVPSMHAQVTSSTT